ncbi:MAG: flagellar basal body P-ring formation chaperone FlgA, partial [Kangiellaceae bacterium]|nr:flagellar basal body P-ring formation chaperone FlgA [Kangiellaceae bacterium]
MKVFSKLLLWALLSINGMSFVLATVDIADESRGVKMIKDQVSAEDVSKSVKKTLTNFLGKRFSKVELEVLTKAIRIPPKTSFDSLVIRNLEKMKFNKRVSVWVELVNRGKKVAQIPVWIKLEVFDFVLVANKDVRAKQRLQKNMYERELRRVTGITEQVISKLPEGKKFWSKKSIKAGEVLSNKSIALEPLVKRSQQIQVDYFKNGISISMQGKALKSGNVGDEIRVKLELSAKPVKATIQGDGKAQIITESNG